jgi:hypothetical protein
MLSAATHVGGQTVTCSQIVGARLGLRPEHGRAHAATTCSVRRLHWASTRARVDPTELDAELGEITVPPLATDAPEQACAS